MSLLSGFPVVTSCLLLHSDGVDQDLLCSVSGLEGSSDVHEPLWHPRVRAAANPGS